MDMVNVPGQTGDENSNLQWVPPVELANVFEGTSPRAVGRLVRGSLRKVSAALKDVRDLKVANEIWNGFEEMLSACMLLLEENTELKECKDELMVQIKTTRERLQRAMGDIEVLSKVAAFDNLTGLLSKNAFSSHMPECFESHKRDGRTFSFLMIDGDEFKAINDDYGHDAGDYVLAELGALARQCFRLGDFGFRGGAEGKYPDNGAGVRFGGDEFCFVLADTGAKDSLIAAERFKKMVDAHKFVYEGQSLAISVSIGVSEVDYDKDQEWNEVAKRADAALYAAKAAGKGKVLEWASGMKIEKKK